MRWDVDLVSRRTVVAMLAGVSLSGCGRSTGQPKIYFNNYRGRIDPRVVITDSESNETVFNETLTLGPSEPRQYPTDTTAYDNRVSFPIQSGTYRIKITLDGETTTKTIGIGRGYMVEFEPGEIVFTPLE